MTRILITALLTLATAAGAAAQTLTLDEAIELAVRHNRALERAAMDVAKAEENIGIARTRRYPLFQVEGQASQLLSPVDIDFGTLGTVTTPRRPVFLLGASAAQPITQLGRLGLDVRQTEAARDVERERERASRLALVNEVKRLYYSVLQTESAIAASEQAIAMLREVERVTGDRVVQQVALRSEALDVGARMARAELQVLTLRHRAAAQKEQLNQRLGRDVQTPFAVAGVPAPAPFERDLAAARRLALEQRPDVQQARLRLRQAELAQRAARADYMPELSAVVSYLSPLNIEGVSNHVFTAGVQLEWEPFDWGRKGRTVATRQIEIRQAEHAVREAEDRAVLEINSLARTLQETRARLRVVDLERETAREVARVRVNQYRVSAALLADVLQAQHTLANADDQYQQALLSLSAASADFEHALGQE